MPSVTILAALPFDAPAISQLIVAFSPTLTIDPDGKGAEQFLQSMTPAAIEAYIVSDDMSYRKAMIDGQLAGVIAMRDGRHLFHMFVAPPYQRRGVATALWHEVRSTVLAAGIKDGITVNSSLAAVPVYERFGFRATGVKVEQHGVVFVPMHWDSGS